MKLEDAELEQMAPFRDANACHGLSESSARTGTSRSSSRSTPTGPCASASWKKNCVSQFRGTISSRTLAGKLKLFRLRGFIERTPYNEVPPRVECRLTEDGEKLAQALCAVLRTAVGKIDRSHSGSMADQSYSMKNPLVGEEWLRNLDASRKFMSKILEKDPHLAKHIANVIMSVWG